MASEKIRDAQTLERLAAQGRYLVLNTTATSKVGHVGGPLGAMDFLIALYFGELDVDPEKPHDPDRDRFILSKGHNAPGLYCALALRGYLPIDELSTFDQGDSRLQAHPDMLKLPGLDASTGSLGMGLSFGAGIALGAKRRGKDFTTWVMLGDGEIEEGMVWETVISAPLLKLDNLVAIVDLNGLQQYGRPALPEDRFDRSTPLRHVNLPRVFEGFGWNVIEVDGNDFTDIFRGIDAATATKGRTGKPNVILSHTTKGHGVSFTSGSYKWHTGVATADQLEAARLELELDLPIGGTSR